MMRAVTHHDLSTSQVCELRSGFHAARKIDRFVTTDTTQEQAAKELGLPV
jgi:hypothetical protein